MDTTNNTISSHVLELHELIAAPLVATIDADTLVAKRYLEFIQEAAFEKSDDKDPNHIGALKVITFTYNQADINGTKAKQVSIPVISLITLPLLQIKEAGFDFDIKIVDAVSDASTTRFQFNPDQSPPQTPASNVNNIKLRASIAPKSSVSQQKNNSMVANMKVKIIMQQADMPAGMSNLLHLTASNMQIDSVS